MIHPQTQEVVPYGISFVELSAKTGIPTDEAVHNKLYGFLSEFSHVHMIASGSYRVKTDSIYDPAPAPYGIYHTIFLCTYCSWLMAHLAAMMPGTAGLLVEVRKDAKFLISALADIEFSEKDGRSQNKAEKQVVQCLKKVRMQVSKYSFIAIGLHASCGCSSSVFFARADVSSETSCASVLTRSKICHRINTISPKCCRHAPVAGP
jgi:hypothetical protein